MLEQKTVLGVRSPVVLGVQSPVVLVVRSPVVLVVQSPVARVGKFPGVQRLARLPHRSVARVSEVAVAARPRSREVPWEKAAQSPVVRRQGVTSVASLEVH